MLEQKNYPFSTSLSHIKHHSKIEANPLVLLPFNKNKSLKNTE